MYKNEFSICIYIIWNYKIILNELSFIIILNNLSSQSQGQSTLELKSTS